MTKQLRLLNEFLHNRDFGGVGQGCLQENLDEYLSEAEKALWIHHSGRSLMNALVEVLDQSFNFAYPMSLDGETSTSMKRRIRENRFAEILAPYEAEIEGIERAS